MGRSQITFQCHISTFCILFNDISTQLLINVIVHSEFKLDKKSLHVKETQNDKLIPCELFISNTDSFGLRQLHSLSQASHTVIELNKLA